MEIEKEFQESYNEFLFRKAELQDLPLMGTIELTPVCNLNCKMCYVRQDMDAVKAQGGLKSIDFWENVIDQAIEAGMLFCLMTGGEIFMYPHFQELYTCLKKKGIHIVLNTNGTLLDRKTIEWLAEIPPRRLNISLYGASPETYERLTGQGNGYDRIMEAFSLLNEYKIPFRVHGVLVPSVMQDYEKLKEICNRFQAPMQLSYYMFPPLRKEKVDYADQERFTPSEMAEAALRYRKDSCGGETPLWREFLEKKCYVIDHYQEQPYYGYNKIRCKSGSSAFWVNWKGELSGCGVSNDDVHSLEKESFKDAWNAIVQYTNEARLSEKCSICQYRDICPTCAAGACCETGRIDGTPEYLCRFSECYADLLRRELWRLRQSGGII